MKNQILLAKLTIILLCVLIFAASFSIPSYVGVDASNKEYRVGKSLIPYNIPVQLMITPPCTVPQEQVGRSIYRVC